MQSISLPSAPMSLLAAGCNGWSPIFLANLADIVEVSAPVFGVHIVSSTLPSCRCSCSRTLGDD